MFCLLFKIIDTDTYIDILRAVTGLRCAASVKDVELVMRLWYSGHISCQVSTNDK